MPQYKSIIIPYEDGIEMESLSATKAAEYLNVSVSTMREKNRQDAPLQWIGLTVRFRFK